MKKQRVFLALGVLLASLGSVALGGAPVIEFKGDSTLHGFSGTGNVLRVEWFDTGRVEVDVASASLCTGNSARDSNLRRLIEADAFPIIRGRLESLPVDSPHAEIILRLRDVERPVEARIQPVSMPDGARALDLQFTVSLASFALKPPSVLGLVRVSDAVDVHAIIPLSPDRISP